LVSKVKGSAQQGELEAATASARLPGLDIEVVHRRSPAGDTEEITINLKAMPSFEAFGRYVEALNPFALWAEAARLVYLPWLAAVQTLTLSSRVPPALPRVASDPPAASSQDETITKV
jgi:hypothetical protein